MTALQRSVRKGLKMEVKTIENELNLEIEELEGKIAPQSGAAFLD